VAVASDSVIEDRNVSRALIVEDDRSGLEALAEFVQTEGFVVRTAERLEKAKAELRDDVFDVVLLDLHLPDGTSLDLLRELESQIGTDVVLITGQATVDSAVAAFRGGAIDYLTKPIDLGRLHKILANVLRTSRLRGEVAHLRDQLRELGRFGPMIGSSRVMQVVYDQILKVAPTDASVFVVGETGTGKELVAETVHALSTRSHAPFIPVNCGAISASLIESELFGHERGSFTGATKRREGFFEQANGGTIFLDEITEMPIELQVKLLRTLESGQIRRLGGDRTIDVDVRIVAATNRDPQAAVADDQLREDLYYRLNVFPVSLPPLREHGSDLELIAAHMLAGLNREAESRKTLHPDTFAIMQQHRWPGNVRELKNVLSRAFILATDEIVPDMLPFSGGPVSRAPVAPVADASELLPVRIGMTTAEAERVLIEATLEHTNGDKKRAARMLGIGLKTLYNRFNQYHGG